MPLASSKPSVSGQAAAATSSPVTTLTQALSPAAWNELIANVGDVPPNSRVEIIINTMVISASREMD